MSEELEEVKQRLSATVLRVARSNGKTHFSNDIRWLIKQAERVEELESDLEVTKAKLDISQNHIDKIYEPMSKNLKQENEQLREALKQVLYHSELYSAFPNEFSVNEIRARMHNTADKALEEAE